ncbi:MAG: CsbD family protein [Janthinobacterium lividum]
MNKDQVKGVGEQVKGKFNEAVGSATGNRSQELKGDVQQGAGKAQQKVGDAKENLKDAVNRSDRKTDPDAL